MIGRIVLAAFIIVPLIEIGLFALLGQIFGALPTLLGVVVTAIAGALLIRWQGLAVLRELQKTVAEGRVPTRQVGDAMLIGLGGLLLLLPGYFTDLLGLFLFIPPVRSLIWALAARHIRVVVPQPAAPAQGAIDLDPDNWRER